MNWLERISRKSPLIECLTNKVTVNDVANSILAVGASPVMGDCEEEVSDFVRMSSAVLLNVGTIGVKDCLAFERALRVAEECGVPVVLDPAGVGAARFRTDFVRGLLAKYPVAVLRGNASEIRTLLDGGGKTLGVDVSSEDEINECNCGDWGRTASSVARTYNCVVSISGAIDVLSDGENVMYCRNGVATLPRVTGTGCSLSGITAAFVAVAKPCERLEAAYWATVLMGCAGELSWCRNGSSGLGSFRVGLIDAMSRMDDVKLEMMRK